MDWQDLNLQPEPEPDQLGAITHQLHQLIFALEALLEETPDSWQRLAAHLNLTPILSDWIKTRNIPTVPSSLSAAEARSLVLIICHVAKQHQALIRRGINLVEQLTTQNRPLDQVALLRDYLTGFTQRYQSSFDSDSTLSHQQITSLALKSLIDLLFYSNPNSPQQLWSVLVA